MYISRHIQLMHGQCFFVFLGTVWDLGLLGDGVSLGDVLRVPRFSEDCSCAEAP